MVASRGIDVVGIDPAWASLEIARAKPHASSVRWLHGEPTTLPPLAVDAVVMTGNVAQVFLTDEDSAATLRAVREALRPGGHFVFETRDPTRRAWQRWTPELTRSVLEVPGVGVVERWSALTYVAGPFMTFRTTTVFHADDVVIDHGALVVDTVGGIGEDAS
jgi:SAM-dependent methyltransferase